MLTATGITTLVVVIALFLMIFHQSLPTIHSFGLGFLTHSVWSPNHAKFGCKSIIIGTLLSTLIASCIAVPLSILSALALTTLIPQRIVALLNPLLDMMAAIPSIIYGIWGLFVMGPFLASHIYPHILSLTGIPLIGSIFSGMPIGSCLLTAGIILAIMIYPYITAMTRDIIQSMPQAMIESAYGMGLNHWQVTRKIIIRYCRAALLGSVVLGMSRALGETMAVTFVIGNSHSAFSGILMPSSTIASTIASEYPEASTHLYSSALMELGLVLFILSMFALWLSRIILTHHGQARGGSM